VALCVGGGVGRALGERSLGGFFLIRTRYACPRLFLKRDEVCLTVALQALRLAACGGWEDVDRVCFESCISGRTRAEVNVVAPRVENR
jgi:hypothetical protein